jgi:hypothetical protein
MTQRQMSKKSGIRESFSSREQKVSRDYVNVNSTTTNRQRPGPAGGVSGGRVKFGRFSAKPLNLKGLAENSCIGFHVFLYIFDQYKIIYLDCSTDFMTQRQMSKKSGIRESFIGEKHASQRSSREQKSAGIMSMLTALPQLEKIMTRLELLALLLSIQALLESGNVDKAKEVIARVIVEVERS